jgi:deazaflavin-dependent oxidoreductase (nitroreductase family)
MSVERRAKAPRVPPRWFIRLAWSVHRGVCRVCGGRVGLWRPRAKGWGTLRLTATGRRTGRQRSVILGYFDDGPNLVSLAMNGWGEGEPAWWLNLQAHPDAIVDLVDGRRLVRAHAATGDERLRLWVRWREIDTNLDGYAALRSSKTAVVVLEPRPGASGTLRCS